MEKIMLKKTLLVAAVGALAAIGGKLGVSLPSAVMETGNTIDEQDALSNCPWCMPRPNCYPGDPCENCG
jgi:hypothetical protein